LFLFFYFISVLEFQSASVIKKWKGKVIFGTTPRHYLLSIKTRCFCYIVFHDYRVVICIDIENSSPFSFYSYRIKKKEEELGCCGFVRLLQCWVSECIHTVAVLYWRYIGKKDGAFALQ
jgi:hypothetical protein